LTFDAALGLGRVSGDGLDREIIEDSADVGGKADAGQLFLVAPVLVVATEGAVAVLIDGDRGPVTAQDHIQELEVSDGVLLGPEESPQDGAGSVVSGMKK